VTDLEVQSGAANAVIELASVPETTVESRERARNVGEALARPRSRCPRLRGSPSTGFVVDRVLFPYLFRVVDLMCPRRGCGQKTSTPA